MLPEHLLGRNQQQYRTRRYIYGVISMNNAFGEIIFYFNNELDFDITHQINNGGSGSAGGCGGSGGCGGGGGCNGGSGGSSGCGGGNAINPPEDK